MSTADRIIRFTINDTYRTDVALLYPPYVIALASLYIAFTLTSMTNNGSARTRSSSSQVTTLLSSIETNSTLGLPPPPTTPAEFLASFEVSLPVLMACVQDIIVLYPIWEAFEPSRGATAKEGDKFGPDDAEALIRRMIEERAVDVGHPDNAGKEDKKRARPA